jgi:hypothetical protein
MNLQKSPTQHGVHHSIVSDTLAPWQGSIL